MADDNQTTALDDQLKKLDDDVYGDQAEGGHEQDLETDDDVDKAVADVTGSPPKNDNYDSSKTMEDAIPEDTDSEDIDAQAGLSESLINATADPFDNFPEIKRDK